MEISNLLCIHIFIILFSEETENIICFKTITLFLNITIKLLLYIRKICHTKICLHSGDKDTTFIATTTFLSQF